MCTDGILKQICDTTEDLEIGCIRLQEEGNNSIEHLKYELWYIERLKLRNNNDGNSTDKIFEFMQHHISEIISLN